MSTEIHSCRATDWLRPPASSMTVAGLGPREELEGVTIWRCPWEDFPESCCADAFLEVTAVPSTHSRGCYCKGLDSIRGTSRDLMRSLLGRSKEQEPGLRAACCSWPSAVITTPLDLVRQPASASGWLWGLGGSCHTNALLWEGHALILSCIIRVLSAALRWASSVSLW